MLISGYTYLKNASSLGYPFIESILSVLSICEEFIIALGEGEDDTEKLILNLKSDKIKIIHTIWNKDNFIGGKEFSRQADIALSECKHEWVLHLQCDEIIHENDLPKIIKLIKNYNSNFKIEGFLFKYLHFYGNYDYICNSPQWYRNEIRLFRNKINVKPYRDSQGFRIDNRKLNVIKTDIEVFHYSRVSNPNLLSKKMSAFQSMYNNSNNDAPKNVGNITIFEQNGESLDSFNGTHPSIMNNRIQKIDWIFNYDPKKVRMSFKYKLKLFFEKLTGYMFFEYKNYKILS